MNISAKNILINIATIIFIFGFEIYANSNPVADSRTIFNTDIYDYNWPTAAKPFITSSFAEYRATHFHAGIDISTEHAIGVEVYASRDGYVKNISVSPFGYGRYLVIKHKDNFYTTYAHLHSFRSDIEKKVLEAQKNEKSYSVEINFEPNEFFVRKGELIAFTGESGAGPPHLHFEIRDHLFNPVNPLLFPNLRNFVDVYPPIFKNIAFSPLNDNSFVNHEFTSQIFRPSLKNSTTYFLKDTIFATGSIGIAADVFDKTSERGDRITIYGLELYIDNKPYFISQRNAFMTAQYGQVSLYYDWNLLQSQQGRFHKLYIDGTNSLSFYPLSVFADKKNEYSGKISLDNLNEGFHKFTIRAIDYIGQITECSGVFVLNHPPIIEVEEISQKSMLLNIPNLKNVQTLKVSTKSFNNNSWKTISYGVTQTSPTQTEVSIPFNEPKPDILKIIAINKYGTESFPYFHILNEKYSFEKTEIKKIINGNQLHLNLKNKIGFTKAPSVVAYDKNKTYPVNLVPISAFEYEGIFTIPEQAERKIFLKGFFSVGHFTTEIIDSVEYFLLRPENGLTISSSDNNFIFAFDKEAVYKPASIFLEKEKNGSFTLSSKNIFLRNGLNIQIKTSSDKILDYSTAVYVVRGNNPIFISKDKNYNNNTFIVKKTSMLGSYEILSDKKGPEISNWKNNLSYNKTNPLFKFKISDNLSGVDVDKIEVTLDGLQIFPVYDSDKKTVAYYNFTDEKINRGLHSLNINLTDRVGNSTFFTKTFSTN